MAHAGLVDPGVVDEVSSIFQMLISLVLILIFFLFCQVNQSTEKTTSLLILGILDGVPSSNWKIALKIGNGTKTGPTMYVKIKYILPKVRIVKSIFKIVNKFLLIKSFYKTQNYLIIVINSLR